MRVRVPILPLRLASVGVATLGLAVPAAVATSMGSEAQAIAAPAALRAAAPASIPEVPVVDVTQLVVDPDLRDQRRLSVLFRRAPMLAADGKLQWLIGTQDRARVASPLLAVAIDPLTTASDVDDLAGSTATRQLWRESRGGTIAGVSAAEGGNWFVDRLAGQPPRNGIVRFDDRLRIVERRPAPSGVRLRSMVATSRGLRAIGIETSLSKDVPGLNDGVRLDRAVVVAGRRVLRQDIIREVRAAAPLPDGSILMTGPGERAFADPVIVMRPDGRVLRLADRRGPNRPESSGRAGVLATRAGVVMDEHSSPSSDPGLVVDPKSVLLLRGRNGEVLVRRKLTDLDYPRPAECVPGVENPRISSLAVGPDGLPVIRLTCSKPRPLQANGSKDYPAYTDVATTMLGLTADLRPRWYRHADAEMKPEGDFPNANVRFCGTDFTGTDGRLLTLGCDGRVTATTVPGALPVTRGTVVARGRAGGRDALVRIACEGPPGAMCAGRIHVSAGGSLRGTAAYALPARPGGARATLDRRIDTPSALPARYDVQLLPPR